MADKIKSPNVHTLKDKARTEENTEKRAVAHLRQAWQESEPGSDLRKTISITTESWAFFVEAHPKAEKKHSWIPPGPDRDKSGTITGRELEDLYMLGRAVAGLVELAGTDAESHSITAASLCALLRPIATDLSELYCAVCDRAGDDDESVKAGGK